MAVQPNYHWQFEEKQGTTVVDTVSGVKAKLSNTTWLGHGRIGSALKIDGRVKNSRIVFDQDVARFGTSDFTIAFGMKVQGTYGQKVLHVIGNRSTSGHGNFFSLRMKKQGQLTFEVDENTRGKNYAFLDSKRPLKDGKWHHIAAVRQGRSLKLYIDGELSDEGKSKTGIANITTDAVLLLGARGLKTPVAQYEDLRIYHTALNAADVKALVPPVNRPLNEGEIELVAADNAAVILTQNVDDLSRFSSSFKQLRVANNTGVTLYQQNDFKGTAQKCYAELPDIRLSRLKNFPKSIRIWSTIGEPFTGKWIIKASNGEFLSLGKNRLTTVPPRGTNKLFKFHHNLQQAQLQLIPGSDQENAFFTLSSVETPTYLFVDDLDGREFSLVNQTQNEWLELAANNTFRWTRQKDSRAIFVRAVKVADNEGQVGELAPGEVALYEHLAYHGKTWILSDSAKHVSGEHRHFSQFQGLQDQTSSIRLGPDTGVTLFKHSAFRTDEDKREEDIEDVVHNVPDLRESQVGNDALSSIKIFRTIKPEDVFSSYTTKLSQDYRMVGNNLEEFSSYRTTLRLKPGAGEIEVSATDLTEIEVEDTTYEIDEVRSVTLSPNDLNFIMITSEADGLNTPGLKIRTNEMASNEQVVIFPNQAAHQQIAELEEGALWNATDAQGNLIVDRKAHSKEEVASVQNTIKRVMATVNYGENAPAANSRVQSSNRDVSGATIDNPWELKLGAIEDNKTRQPGRGRRTTPPPSRIIVKAPIGENKVSKDEWQQLLSQAISSEDANGPETSSLGTSRVVGTRRAFRRIGRRFKNAIKKAASVVIGTVKDVVHVIVKTAEEVIDFVVDTAEKVAEFVEAVVEKVVSGIKKFIEFLQFLFNWDDILDTQRYLVGAINAGFDYASQQADAAKAPVSAFMDNLQETVEEGMNQLITTLGGEPSEVRESGFKLPEAAEWFFSKLLGNSKKDSAKTVPESDTLPSGDSELENFAFHFTEALEDSAGAVIRGFEGMGETIATLLANPLQPQLALVALIEVFRDVTIQLLEAVENLALGFLDVIAEAVEQIQKLLNTEIKIPFISNLFELIGAGKLTILNLAGLLLAIPVTVVSKLVMGEAPFKNEPPLDFSAPSGPVTGQTGARLVAQQSAIAQRSDTSARERSIRIWGIIGLTADALNGVINAGLDLSSEFGPKEKKLEETAGYTFEFVSLLLSGFSWLASFPSSPDFPGGRPYNVAAHKVTKGEDKPEYEERVMWGWRTFVYWLDVVILANKGVAVLRGNEAKLQRIRRAEPKSIGVFCVFSILDAIYAIQYLAAVPREDKSGFEIANEVVSWIPNILAPLRTTGPKGAVALAALDFVAMTVNMGLGGKLLADDLAEL
ncbi:egf domain-containing protein [Leptolyngbya sp. Heron Island J]|uniref:LamG domain-containing protein n=1 Tax=Leptolyngbya sp. Heron Island J TaxID=1385935 RepID=UPI0003B9459D|nr:LamG domain-containing protein [Leptolyngbya sp. Heron Island J]ESA36374.1 egf domain-containing protein [Leptolyngbya sp. Heron Island J]